MARLAESALVKLDRSLLSALVDRWRPETHTFHLPCGEMAPTLQDVAMLLGLPITGDAVGPRVVPSTWLEDLEQRFAGVATTIDPEDFNEHPQSKGPSKSCLLQFQVQLSTKRCVDAFYSFEIPRVFFILNVRTLLQPDLLAADADDYSVTRSPEADLLWLFGYIMLNNSHGHYVDRVLLPYAQVIADAYEDAIPLYCWGSAVLAFTYRGLCNASRQNDRNVVLTGCPILLQFWSYERIAIGCPMIDQSPYTPDMYGDTEETDPPWGLSGTLDRYGPDKKFIFYAYYGHTLFSQYLSYGHIIFIFSENMGTCTDPAVLS